MSPDGDSGESTFVITDRAVESRFTCFFVLSFVLFISYITKYIKTQSIRVFEMVLGDVKHSFEYIKYLLHWHWMCFGVWANAKPNTSYID